MSLARRAPSRVRLGTAALLLCGLAGCRPGGEEAAGARTAGAGACARPAPELSLFVAGDAILVEPWSDGRDPRFVALIEAVRSADVAVANLETVVHEFRGHAQADSGGVHLASPPAIASELAWAGFDLVSHANNHTFDYGATGVLETLEHVANAGIALAGSGRDLEQARAPAFFRARGGTVGLVAAASSYVPYGRAGRSRADLPGRPGLNPLSVSFERTLLDTRRLRLSLRSEGRVDPEDLAGNLDSLRAAREAADLVLFSLHAHRSGDWLRSLAQRAIEAGADLVFVHGPHQVRGIAIHQCRPIFYGLGDFAYQPHLVRRLPPEAYRDFGLPDDAPFEALQRERARPGAPGSYGRAEVFEGIGARVRFAPAGVAEIRLLPVDLGFDQPLALRGAPRLADAARGREIVGAVARRSRRFGTEVVYLEPESQGRVTLGIASE